MTDMINSRPARTDLVALAERASLYQLLLSALQHQRKAQQLPPWLYADLGLPPTPERAFVPRGR